MHVDLSLKQAQALSPKLLHTMKILQMSTLELDAYIQELVQENPVLEAVDPPAFDETGEALYQKYQALTNSDPQNRQYLTRDREDFDPLARAGTSGGLEETLSRHLQLQLQRLCHTVSPDVLGAAGFLVDCLDGRGYLREEPEALARRGTFSREALDQGLTLLQSLQPAGVGARNLAECLTLQLERQGEQGPILTLVRDHLEHLARNQYLVIAKALGISQEEVLALCSRIRTLEPYPGGAFAPKEPTPYLVPDVFVLEDGGELKIALSDSRIPSLHINGYYETLYQENQDQQVHAYLTEKMKQAAWSIQAIEQRRSTLLGCVQVVVQRQRSFFEGDGALVPLTQAEVAAALSLHESTVSRALRDKYLQCARGVFPLSDFFPRELGTSEVSNSQVKELLPQLLAQEDPCHPLSDARLTELLQDRHIAVSRRTVAKYREELGIPNASGRKQR